MINTLYQVSVTGVGKCLPEFTIKNDDLSQLVDTNDEWIASRSGIKERKVVSGNETAASLASKAAIEALSFAGVAANEVDLIICATSLPDNLYPSCACEVQGIIGAKKAAAFDLVAACSGLIYAMKVGQSFIASGQYENVLIVGVDVHSRFLNWQDRTTCVLFGDGAGAVLLQKSYDDNNILNIDINADGSKSGELKIPLAGKNCPLAEPNQIVPQQVCMNGKEIFKFAVGTVPDSILKTLDKINLKPDDVDKYILHQANIRIISSIAEKLGQNIDKFYVNLNKYGNTSSASIAIAIADAVEENAIKCPSTIVLSGFGAGLTWGTAVIKWNAKDKRKN